MADTLLGTPAMEGVLERIAELVGDDYEDLALSRVAARRDPFHVLIACIVSLRTRDEVTAVAGPRLIEAAPTPNDLAALDEAAIERLIYPSCFYRNKAKSLRALAVRLRDDFGGRTPDTIDELVTLPGVGRKTANLVVTLGYRKAGICVDIHVHRISNRLGYVVTRSADETEQALRSLLPGRWWIPINDLLVTWGRTVCTPLSPHCSTCPVQDTCHQAGVERHR